MSLRCDPNSLIVVDPGEPLPVDAKLLLGEHETVGVLVLAGDGVVTQTLRELFHEVDDFLVPGDVVHREGGGYRETKSSQLNTTLRNI